jgi:hypothetical protein
VLRMRNGTSRSPLRVALGDNPCDRVHSPPRRAMTRRSLSEPVGNVYRSYTAFFSWSARYYPRPLSSHSSNGRQFVNISWYKLKRLGTNSTVRSANVWALIVPVAAKLMDGVQDVVTMDLFGHKFPLHVALPFSWKVLFVAAMAFLRANLLFNSFCPPLVKATDTYRDFADQIRSGLELKVALAQLRHDNLTEESESDRWIEWLNHRHATLTNPTQTGDLVGPGKIESLQRSILRLRKVWLDRAGTRGMQPLSYTPSA